MVHVTGDHDALAFADGGFGEEPGLVESGLDDDDLGALSGAEVGGGFAVNGEGDAGFAVELLPAFFGKGAGVFDEVDLVAGGFGEGEEEVANGFAGGLFVGIETPAQLGVGGGGFAKKEAFGDEVAADFQFDGVEFVGEGAFDLGAIEFGEGVVAGGDFHFFKHPVLVEAGGGIHFGTAEGAAHEGPAPFALEVGEAFVESGVAEFGPGMEAGEAVAHLNEGSFEFAPGGGGVELGSARFEAIARDIEVGWGRAWVARGVELSDLLRFGQ